jgi:hypothetical protein
MAIEDFWYNGMMLYNASLVQQLLTFWWEQNPILVFGFNMCRKLWPSIVKPHMAIEDFWYKYHDTH